MGDVKWSWLNKDDVFVQRDIYDHETYVDETTGMSLFRLTWVSV